MFSNWLLLSGWIDSISGRRRRSITSCNCLSETEGLPLFVFLEFCLSSFGFSILKERAFVPKHCHSTLYQRSLIFRFSPALHPPLVSQSQDIFVLFWRLTTYSSQTCFIFRFNCHLNQITLTEAVLCSCQDAVSFINELFNHGPPGGLCYSNASRIILHQQSRIII